MAYGINRSSNLGVFISRKNDFVLNKVNEKLTFTGIFSNFDNLKQVLMFSLLSHGVSNLQTYIAKPKGVLKENGYSLQAWC